MPKADRDYTGRKFVLDWKTAGNLDVRWRDRLLDSWQWKIYCHFTGADIFIYRGITRPKRKELARGDVWECDTRELIIEVPFTNSQEVEEMLRGVAAEYRALLPLDIWPRHMPGACNSYGTECVFYADCRSYESIPRYHADDKNLSYSEIERFLLCPERARRMQRSEKDVDGTDSTAFGQTVHRGVAELYKQVYQL